VCGGLLASYQRSSLHWVSESYLAVPGEQQNCLATDLPNPQ
jgi:hypothetical protein